MKGPTRRLPIALTLPVVTAGFVAVLVGVSSSVTVVLAAAEAGGATASQASSWLLALCLGMAGTGIALSLRYHIPVVVAWSTPGAALLVSSLPGVPMSTAVGAFLFASGLSLLCGVTGWFERAMERIPMPLVSGLLAGVLLRFGVDMFAAIQDGASVIIPMIAVYLVARRRHPRYALVAALIVGLMAATADGGLHFASVRPQFVGLEFIRPAFDWQVLASIGIPLFVVTMSGQNVPGVAAIRSAGYAAPVSPLISWTGLANLALAPFGAFSIGLSVITAAICLGDDVNEDPAQRYWAGVWTGIFFLVVAAFAGTVGAALAAFPPVLILALVGLGLMGTIGNALTTMVADPHQRDPALITFLFTTSDITVFGIGSAFWGLIAGLVALVLVGGTRLRRQSSAASAAETSAAVPSPDGLVRK